MEDPSFDSGAPEAPAGTVDPLPIETPDPPIPDAFLTGDGFNTGSTKWVHILADATSGPWTIVPGSAGLTLQSAHFWDATFSSSENTVKFDHEFTTAAVSNAPNTMAALGMVSPPATSPLRGSLSLAELCLKFGVSPEKTPAVLQEFLNAVEATGSLSLLADLGSRTRNAMWAVPDIPYRIAVSIQFSINDSGFPALLESFLDGHFGPWINTRLLDPIMIFTNITTYSEDLANAGSFKVDVTYRLIVRFRLASFEVSATFSPSGLDLSFSDFVDDATPRASIVDRLAAAIARTGGNDGSDVPTASDIPNPSSRGAFNTLFSTVDLWYLSMGRTISDWQPSIAGGPVQPVYGPIFWQVSLLVVYRNVVFGLLLDTRTFTFTGELLFRNSFPNLAMRRSYEYNRQVDLPQTYVVTIPDEVDLWSLFSDSVGHPQIPSHVVEAKVSYRKGQDESQSTFGITAKAISRSSVPATPSSNAAPAGFSWNEIMASGTIQTNGTDTTVDIQVAAAFELSPPPGATVEPATLRINMEYYSGSFWLLHGRVENLSVGLLYNYFDNDVRDSAIAALGKLNLRSLDMLYTFQDQGPSSFLMTAILVLGELELDLSYQYVSGLLDPADKTAADLAWEGTQPPANTTALRPDGSSSHWEFRASLGVSSPSSTVGSVIDSISANAAATLPTFVSNIGLAPSSREKDFVKLYMSNMLTAEGFNSGSTILIVWLTLLDFSLTFVSVAAADGITKRILRVSLDEIPLVKDIPLIKELPQPFDKLLYLWIDDQSSEGLTEAELHTMNAVLQTSDLSIDPIPWKQTNQAGSPVAALAAGHHFMIVDKGAVVLDHCFDNVENDTPSPNALISTRAFTASDAAFASGGEQDSAPTKGNLDKQLPFLSISAVSLQYRRPSVVLSFDATVVLGPVTFSVIGFEVALDLSGFTLDHLDTLIEHGISVSINGLSVKVDHAPLLIAGVFIHENSTTAGVSTDIFKGGLALGFETWQFLAVGEYASVVVRSGDSQATEYKSVFVFAKLDGPLITLTFATVSGVRIGFGYNSLIRSPSVNELPHFPLLTNSGDSGAGNDPMKILLSMTDGANGLAPWVSVKQDSYWIAAGLTVTAFGILSVTAVLMLGFRNSGVVISVLADGVAQMPPAVPSDATLFYVEIGMIAELNTIDGYFTVQAALAPSSHILVSSCRLTGGFALVNWFHPSVHSGDFVFTVGGYHRAYTPPPWYPVPDRLGVSFTLGDMINVTGNAYFAITPKCVMGGGSLHLGLDVGPVSAWLDILLDVFIQFKPFHYTADLSVSVGCAISINVWFVHVRISVSVGAALHIEGPDPFGGFANVDFYVCSFTIHFGGSVKPPDPIPLEEFYNIVAVPGANTTDATGPPEEETPTSAESDATKIKFTIIDGLSPPDKVEPSSNSGFPSFNAATLWRVKPGTFSCTVAVDFALSEAYLSGLDDNGKPVNIPLFPANSTSPPPSFYSKPMHVVLPISSVLYIQVFRLDSDGSRSIVEGFTGTMIMKDVPVSIWGMYNRDEDPAVSPSSPVELKHGGNATMNLCLGIRLVAPSPQLLPPSPVGIFDATVAFREMLDPTIPKHIRPIEPTQNSLLALSAHTDETDAQTRWDKVKNDWTNAANDGRTVLEDQSDGSAGLIGMLATRLGWDQPPPDGTSASSTTDGTPEWVLKSSPPAKLISDLGSTYPILPMYAAAMS